MSFVRRRRKGCLALGLLVSSALALGGTAYGGTPPSVAPPPPPAVNWNSVPAGGMTLVAVLPHGSSSWIPASAAGVHANVASGGRYVTLASSAGPAGSTATTATSNVSPDYEFGCSANDTTPFWNGSDLQGRVAWYDCIDVYQVADTVGLQQSGKSAGYWNLTTKYDGVPFTAYSLLVTNCQFVLHQWRTEDSAEIESDEGDFSYWAGESAYANYYC